MLSDTMACGLAVLSLGPVAVEPNMAARERVTGGVEIARVMELAVVVGWGEVPRAGREGRGFSRREGTVVEGRVEVEMVGDVVKLRSGTIGCAVEGAGEVIVSAPSRGNEGKLLLTGDFGAGAPPPPAGPPFNKLAKLTPAGCTPSLVPFLFAHFFFDSSISLSSFETTSISSSVGPVPTR